MSRSRQFLLVLCSLALLVSTAHAQYEERPKEAQHSVAIQIDLPPDTTPLVSVSPGSRHVMVELPRGAIFPLDLSTASGGLLRGGEVTPLGEERVQLRLELAGGLLDRVVFAPDTVVLLFLSRYATLRANEAAENPYVLGADDELLITIHNHPELTSSPTVTAEGLITAPLVGDVVAAGLTPRELERQLSEMLGRSYLVDPQVDVEVEEYRSQWVLVTGEVRLPSRVFLHGGTTLKEALSVVGGFAEFAGETITVSRKNADSGDYEILNIDRREFEAGIQDPVLRHGDIVEVARSRYCYLQGEVRVPGRVQVERGMTLLRALALVGGLTEWADRKSVRVLYEEGTVPKERVFNLKRIQSGRDPDPPLTGGEVMVVKRRFF
jgi:polysaccharide export outer membrane protein